LPQPEAEWNIAAGRPRGKAVHFPRVWWIEEEKEAHFSLSNERGTRPLRCTGAAIPASCRWTPQAKLKGEYSVVVQIELCNVTVKRDVDSRVTIFPPGGLRESQRSHTGWAFCGRVRQYLVIQVGIKPSCDSRLG